MRKVRMGMIGGGKDAFIGAVHRMAAALDGEIELVCGAFSSTPEKSKASGDALYLPSDRVYPDFETMIEKEKQLPEGQRMDFVSIVTPNHMHFAPAKMALKNGFHVVCDKPMTLSLDEARELRSLVNTSGLLFCLTHNYTGYPMVKEARHMVREGKIGKVRKVVVGYPQGWLSRPLEKEGAVWRTSPEKAGKSGCMGDIGTHAENLAEYVTGLRITELCADLSIFVPDRRLDDDGNVLIHLENDAKGILYASQISAGEENELKLQVYGEKGSIEWLQSDPNQLIVKWLDKPKEILKPGVGYDYLSAGALSATRLPAGHPEGYIEAFANIYRNFARTLRSRLQGEKPDPQYLDFPDVEDGLRGLAFIETLVASNASTEKWTKMVE